ncbi:MAG: MoaD/ThiS family protein [Actinomycetota bacterium]
MATVHLMTQHRPFAGGESVVEADGATVGQVIDDLEARYPGLGEALRAGSSAGIDGEIHAEPEFVRVEPDTVIYFVAPLTGG